MVSCTERRGHFYIKRCPVLSAAQGDCKCTRFTGWETHLEFNDRGKYFGAGGGGFTHAWNCWNSDSLAWSTSSNPENVLCQKPFLSIHPLSIYLSDKVRKRWLCYRTTTNVWMAVLLANSCDTQHLLRWPSVSVSVPSGSGSTLLVMGTLSCLSLIVALIMQEGSWQFA